VAIGLSAICLCLADRQRFSKCYEIYSFLCAIANGGFQRLLARGDWLFATGDVASARLLYERAADAGEARAAVRLGETFDPVYLDASHRRGLHGDPDMAVLWYRHARDLGATGVASRLKKLAAKEGRN
jgi:hypothetical protein